MKIVKNTSVFIIVIIIIFVISFCAYGQESINSFLESTSEDLMSVLDTQTKDILSEMGVDLTDYNSVFNLSFTDILKSIGSIFKVSSKDSIILLFKLLAMLIVMIAVKGLNTDEGKKPHIIDDVFSLVCVISSASVIEETLLQFSAAFKLTGKFMYSYIPVLTVLLSVSGNITGSAIYNSVALVMAQLITTLADSIILPVMGIYFALISAMSFNDIVGNNKLAGGINKAITGLVSFVTVIFTFFLSAKNILAKDIDGVLYRSGKYILTGIVPVIGSSIGSILNSIIGSLSLIKSTVAVFAVVAVFIINLPVLIRLSLDRLILNLIATVGDTFGEKTASGIFKSFSGGLKILVTLTAFEVILVVISTGLIILIKGEL